MATAMLNSDSRRLYSWWWDSHIPKNSKWLQENLTDMDAKVKAMIKLIEEDADSFARRAEMYYKKRPELMKLVEEFYRAYRALAERYDHATGELRQAHRTMAEAFPNQVPFALPDDSPSGTSVHEREPHTPEPPHPVRALLDLDDLHKDALGLSADLHAIRKHGLDSAESLAIMGKRGLKQLHEMFGVADGITESKSSKEIGMESPEPENKDKEKILSDQVLQLSDENQNLKNHALSETERAGRAESEIEELKKALADMHTEKESILLQYQQSMQKLSNLEGELQRAETYSRGYDDQASKAAAEVQTLRETLVKQQEEKESSSVRQKELSERILNLESVVRQAQKDAQGLNERAIRSEVEAQYLERELARVETEKNAGLVQYKECLENILNLEKKLLLAQEEARLCDERANRAESEVRELKITLSELNKEKEDAGRQYENCLEKICKMENKLSCAQEEIRSLNNVLLLETSKLEHAEEKCSLFETSNHSLRSEADNLAKKIALKDQELFEKLQALEKLEACVQDEHLHFVQVEGTLKTLQDLHSQSQDEQKALALELENVLQMLKDLEIFKTGLENEIRQVKDENRLLNEKNSSSSISMDDLQIEILRLTKIKERLEEDVRVQTIQINSLHEEICRLKEHMDDLSERYQDLMEQVQAVGLKPDCILSSVKDLQDENTKLRLICEEDRKERTALIRKLDNMDQILKEKTVLESSMSNLSTELDSTREKAQALQDSCKLLHGEKSVLVAEKAAIFCQLQIITENTKHLLEKNAVLENCLSGANVDLEGLRAKSKSLEEICKLLNDDKSNLLSERKALVVQLDNVERRLENLENRFCLLEQKYVGMEKEKEYTLSKVEELKVSLDEEKQERETFSLSSGLRLACLENNLQLVQEESKWRKKEFEEELDRAVNAQLEVFILQKFVQDMEQKNYSLLIECQKHAEASKLTQKVISELEDENLEQQMEAEHLLDEIEKLRRGVYGVFMALEDGEDNEAIKKLGNEQLLLHHITEKIETMKCSLSNFEDDKQQLVVENSVLLTLVMQLRVDGSGIESAKEILQQDLSTMNEQFQITQSEKEELLEANSKLKSEVHTADQKANALKVELEKLSVQHADLHGAYLVLQREYSQVTEENKFMLTKLSQLKNEKSALEEDNDYILLETLALENVSVVLKTFMAESVLELKSQSEELHHFHGMNTDLKKEIDVLRVNLETRDADNLLLKDLLTKFEKDLHETRDLNNQLTQEISIGQGLLHQNKIDASEAEKKFRATEKLNSELCGAVEELMRQSEESNIAKEKLEKFILEISEENACQSKQIEGLKEANKNLESELGMLHEEIEESRSREDTLSSELHEISNEFEVWEAEAATFHFDLNISSIREALFEHKVHELTQVCQSLESEKASKTSEIEQMKEAVGCMATKIGGLEAQLSSYAPVIESLKDNIASFEHNIFSDPVFNSSGNPKPEDVELDNHFHGESFQDVAEDCVFKIPNGIPELKKLQDRIKAVEMVVTKEIQLARKGCLNSNRVLEASRKEIKESESNHSFHLKNDNQNEETESGNEFSDKLRLQEIKPEYSEMKNGILMKDIPLDHISNSSFCARSRRKSRGADDQMLELWETAENDVGLDITFRTSHKQEYPLKEDDSKRQVVQLIKPGSENPSSELEMERELGVDRLGVPTTKLKQEGTRRKVFERLDLDAQKLKTIQTTVEDLRSKMETNEKLRKKKKVNVDVETVKEQLQEVEETIVELVEVNGQLKRNIEETFLHSDGKASEDSEVAWSGQRKKVSEQARKGSEKIGRLQLEVQKIQYVLLKLEDEKKSKAKNRFCRNKTSIVMRDFIYHGGTSSPRMKKGCLRGCFRSSTSRDGTNSNLSS